MTAEGICSFLYVPGARADRVAKAYGAGADAVLIDLEDSVAFSAKEAARTVAVDSLHSRSGGSTAVWVRINAGELGRLDAAALGGVTAALGGLVLAKCDDLDWLDEIASVIPPSVPLSPLIESARGLRRLDSLCAHPRVNQCHLGEIDLLADLGAHGNAGRQLLGHARAELLYASAAAMILPPMGGVYADVRDLEGLGVDSAHLAELGFAGRPAIHPAQVPLINAAFRPSAEELETAATLVASYDEALARGQGVVSDEQGRMVDEAVVRRARRLLAGQQDESENQMSDEAAGVLDGMRVIEGSAFVAAPLGGMTLAQMGADVIRFDAIGGGIDFHRWPVTPGGSSLFWAGMNKGKRSLAVDVRRPEGQELVTALICGRGTDAGIFLSNFPATGWLSDERLRAQRADLIYVNIIGNPDGSTAVDYTVNPSSGFAYATGPAGSSNPTNHVLPAWDVATGLTAATSLLAAERLRTRTGRGGLVTISLADVAFAMVANLGYVAQAQVLHEGRPPIGNDMYGAFGRDFVTADDRRVMVVAISLRQWQSLARATEIEPHLPAMEKALGLDFRLEGDRFEGRDALAALIAPWVAKRSLTEVAKVFDDLGVCWGPYQTFTQLVEEDWRCSEANPMFTDIDQPGIGTLRTPGTPVAFVASPRRAPRPAPLLGQHTDEILAQELGLSGAEIGALHDAGVVAGPEDAS